MGSFQTSIHQYAEHLGPVGSYDPQAELADGINDSANAAQVVDVSIDTVANTTEYQFELDGVPIAFTSDAAATDAEIQAGLIAAVAAAALAFGPNSAPARVTATAVGTDTVRITETNPELGQISVTETDANLSLATVTAHAEDEPLNGGQLVVAGAGGDRSIRLPSTGTDVVLGITVNQAEGADLDDPSTAHLYPALSQVPYLRKGRVVVEVEETVTRGDPVYARFTAGAGGTVRGAFRNDDDGGTALLVPNTRFDRGGTAGSRAVVDANLPG